MLVSDKIIIKINHKNYKYYKEKGYFLEIGQELEIYVKDLPMGSHIKIDIKCDRCYIEKNYIYQGYNKYTKNQTIPYFCNKCNVDRIKESFENKYGKGITNSMHVEEFRQKQKINLNLSLTDDVIKKRKVTNNIKYGYNTPCENSEIKQKLIMSILSKTNFDKIQINKKREYTLLSKYGVKNINQLEEILNKSKETKIRNFNQVPDDKLTDFQLYRKKVTSFTNKNKYLLFENWNGYDYYDGEYIRNNFILDKTNKLYPTIDHKFSVFNGYINEISPEEISSLVNLCITTKSNNSKKKSRNEN